MSDLIRAFHGAVAAAVARFDGNVAKLMGDGALVYFGYPRAHEDDAERAVRAALALVEAIAALPTCAASRSKCAQESPPALSSSAN